MNDLIWSLIFFLILYFLWLLGFRNYRIDSFRSKLFILRSKLFLIGAEKNVDFTLNSELYMYFVKLINGTIYFAEEISIYQLLIAKLVKKYAFKILLFDNIYKDKFDELLSSIKDQSLSKKIKDLDCEYKSILLTYLFHSSPVMFLLYLCYKLFMKLFRSSLLSTLIPNLKFKAIKYVEVVAIVAYSKS